MIRSKLSLMMLSAVPLLLAFATAGCATRGYVRRNVGAVDKKVDTLSAVTDAKFVSTGEKIELVAGIHQKDLSQVNERISSAELKLGLANTAAQQAQTDAQRAQAAAASAMSESQENARKLAASQQAAPSVSTSSTDALKLVESADVTFGFNKFSLTPEAKTELDQLATKVQSLPRVAVELVGFTDTVGPEDYNLNLSRERADSVQRYLVTQKVPLHVIHTVGLGAESAPSGLEGDSGTNSAEASRRVHIRIFGSADTATRASAAIPGQN